MLINDIKIILNTVDITHLIEKDSFPEYFEESMKGKGYFEYDVKPLVFVIKTTGSGITPARGDWMEIVNNVTGKYLLRGKIDEVADDECPTPEITVFPQALLLKDTPIGEDVELSTGETAKDYEFSIRHIRDTVNDILSQVNAEHGSFMYADEDSIPDATNTGRFFGSLLQKFGGFSFQQIILDILGYSDNVYIRKNDGGQYYLIHQDGSMETRLLAKKAAWLNVSLDKEWTIFGVKFGFNFGRFKVPSVDLRVPDFTTIYHIWLMAGGDLEFLGDFDNDDGYGTKYTANAATNVPENKFISFAEEQGMKTNEEVIASFDYDSESSYALVSGNFKNDFKGHTIAISFDTVFDDEYAGHYRNAKGTEIIRDITVIANRWLYVDREGLVYLLPRASSRGTVEYPTKYTLDARKRVRKETDPDLEMTRYEENDDGEAISYGLKLRQTEVDAALAIYKNLFTGEVTERDLEMLNTIEDDILKTVYWENKPSFDTIGTVISIKHSFLKPVAIATVEDGV